MGKPNHIHKARKFSCNRIFIMEHDYHISFNDTITNNNKKCKKTKYDEEDLE